MNNLFLGYAKHEQEKEDIIQEIIRRYECGEENMTLSVDDGFSETEFNEIAAEVARRIKGGI